MRLGRTIAVNLGSDDIGGVNQSDVVNPMNLTTDQRWPAALCSEMRTAEAGRIPPGNLGLGPWGSHGETATKH